jgi:hypothetical protein
LPRSPRGPRFHAYAIARADLTAESSDQTCRAGQRLSVACPGLLKARIRANPAGTAREIIPPRAELAREHGADATCPISTAVFPRSVAACALEPMEDDPPPFRRLVAPQTPLACRLSCGPDFIRHRRAPEAQ